MVDRRLVREVEVALERLVDDARARAAAAVVEIDDGAVEREGLLDLAPVVLVVGQVGRRSVRPSGRRRQRTESGCRSVKRQRPRRRPRRSSAGTLVGNHGAPSCA